MVRVWFTFVVVFVAFAVGANVAQAKEKESKGAKKARVEDVFKKLDKNSDGKLTKDEFVAFSKEPEKAKALFDKVDANRDGSISLEEFKVWTKRVESRAKKKAENGEKPEKK